MSAWASFRQSLATARAPLQARWRSLEAPQQRVARAVFTLLALMLAWLWVVSPLLQSHRRLTEQRPQLASKLLQMRAQAAAVQSLRSLPVVAGNPSARLADLASVQEIMGADFQARLGAGSNGAAQFSLTAKQHSYASLIDKLDQLQARFRLRVLSLQLTQVAGTPSGLVSVTLVLGDAAPNVSSGLGLR